MGYTWDPDKDELNRVRHEGLGLSDFAGFDSETITLEDTRKDYGEKRYQTFGRIGGLGYMIAYTLRDEEIRLISFRRAHDKEMVRYEQ